jgi:hypothetical protein
MEPRFTVDARGALATAEAQSPLAGRSGSFWLQNTSPDWLLFLRSPALGGVTTDRPRVVLAGDTGSFPLSDLIGFLGQSRWTGVLRVSGPTGERSLLFKDGEVRSAASDSSGDRIGEVMVRLGYVRRAQLEAVLDEAPPSRLGKVMVERDIIKAHDLYRCLNEQIADIFHGMMLAREGSFALIDQEIEEKTLTHALSLSTQGLLMDSIRKIDELAQFRKRIPHGKLYVVKKRVSDGRLEKEEEELLKRVNGLATVVELGQAGKVSEFEATRIVYRLLEGGFVQLSAQPATAAPPASAATTPSGQVARQAASAPAARLDEKRVLEVFNVIFREVRDEVAMRGNLKAFIASANAALKGGAGVSSSPVLSGLSFSEAGVLDEAQVSARYRRLANEGHMGSEPLLSLKQALSDVMFFLLFQAGELLESRADEDLARRVKELLATIDPK